MAWPKSANLTHVIFNASPALCKMTHVWGLPAALQTGAPRAGPCLHGASVFCMEWAFYLCNRHGVNKQRVQHAQAAALPKRVANAGRRALACKSSTPPGAWASTVNWATTAVPPHGLTNLYSLTPALPTALYHWSPLASPLTDSMWCMGRAWSDWKRELTLLIHSWLRGKSAFFVCSVK